MDIMLGAFRNLFAKSRASSVPTSSSERDKFLKQLGASDIFVIAAMQSDGIDPHGMTEEQLLAEIKTAVEDMNKRQGFEPFVYEANGKCRLPFFTSNKHAQTFVGVYSKQRNRVYPFQLLGVKGSLLAKVASACDVLVMNDRTAEEVVFSEDDMASIQRIWS